MYRGIRVAPRWQRTVQGAQGRHSSRSYATTTASEQAGTAASVNNASLEGHKVEGGMSGGARRASATTTGSASSLASGAQARGQAVAERAKEGAQVLATRVSGYTQQAGGLFQHYLPGLQYHSQTALAIFKQVYVHQRLAPPSLAEVQSVYSAWFARVRSPEWYVKTIESLRNYSLRDLGYIAVIVVEVYGIFAIGQMIGRRKIVGTLPKLPQEH